MNNETACKARHIKIEELSNLLMTYVDYPKNDITKSSIAKSVIDYCGEEALYEASICNGFCSIVVTSTESYPVDVGLLYEYSVSIKFIGEDL